MTKSNKDFVDEWSETINNMSIWNNANDNKLSPNKHAVENISQLANSINEFANRIQFVTRMAHEELIDFEIAQQIINKQKDEINEDIKYLQTYLNNEDKGEI